MTRSFTHLLVNSVFHFFSIWCSNIKRRWFSNYGHSLKGGAPSPTSETQKGKNYHSKRLSRLWSREWYARFSLERYVAWYPDLRRNWFDYLKTIQFYLITSTLFRSSEKELAEIADLTKLQPLTEDLVLRCLRARYQTNRFYTWAGVSLLALNPLRDFPALYSTKSIWEYHLYDGPIKDLPPHVFSVGKWAYFSMVHR